MGWSLSTAYNKVTSDELLGDVKETAGNTLDTVGSGILTGGKWAGNLIAWGWSLNPVIAKIAQIEKAHSGEDNFLTEKHNILAEEATNVAHLAEDEGKVFVLKELGQGVANAVTSTVGMISDGLRVAGTAAIDMGSLTTLSTMAKMAATEIYNLGVDNEEGKVSWGEQDKLFPVTSAMNEMTGGGTGWSTWLNTKTQFTDRIKPTAWVDLRERLADGSLNPRHMRPVEVDERKFITDEDGNKSANLQYEKPLEVNENGERPDGIKLSTNPYANAKYILRNSGQAITEVPMFFFSVPVVAGSLSAAFSASRLGNTAKMTFSTLKRTEMVADTIPLVKNAEKLGAKVAKETTEEFTKETSEYYAKNFTKEGAQETKDWVTLPRTESTPLYEAAKEAADSSIAGKTGRTLTDNKIVNHRAEKQGITPEEYREGGLAHGDLKELAAKKSAKTAGKLKFKTEELERLTAKKGTADEIKEATEELDRLKASESSAEELTKATNKLEELKTPIGSPKEIEKATKAVMEATIEVQKKLQGVNSLAKYMKVETFSVKEATSLERAVKELDFGDRLKNGYEVGAHRAYRLLDPLDNPTIESLGAGGSFAYGVHVARKAAKEEGNGNYEIMADYMKSGQDKDGEPPSDTDKGIDANKHDMGADKGSLMMSRKDFEALNNFTESLSN